MPSAFTISEVTYDTNLPIMDREQIDMLLMVDDADDPSSLVRELFDLFRGESVEKLNALDSICESNDLLGLRKTVHFVAGSAGNLGMSRLCAFYRAIERAIDEKRLTEISNCAVPVRTEFELACEAFGREFSL